MKRITIVMAVVASTLLGGCDEPSSATKAGPVPGTVAKAAVEMSKSVPKGWIEDFATAKRQAASEKKKIVMAFSGSDWCGWCVKMDRDVYSRPEFIDQALKRYVLVMIDYPQDRGILSPLAAKQNEGLLRKYGINSFPATLVLDADGNVLSSLSGYVQGGPEAMLKALDGSPSAGDKEKGR